MGNDESLLRVYFSMGSGFDIADIDDIVSWVAPEMFGARRQGATHWLMGLEETINGVVLEFVTTNPNDLQAAILKWTSSEGVSRPEFSCD